MHETRLAFGPLLSLAEVARELDLNVETVRREIRRGNLVALRVGERQLRVARSDLLAYLVERREPVA